MYLEIDENVDPWLGSYYELAIEMESRSDASLVQNAVNILIGSPYFQGIWDERSQILKEEPLAIFEREKSMVGYGALHIQPDIQLGVVVHTLDIDHEAKWLSVCIPTAMLNVAYNINYPLHTTPNPWRAIIDEKLASIADYISTLDF